jgi:hypothetical protein
MCDLDEPISRTTLPILKLASPRRASSGNNIFRAFGGCLSVLVIGSISTKSMADNTYPDSPAHAQQSSADDYSAYFLTPFKLATQPVLKQSVLLFGGRTNSGNLGDTFKFGIGVPSSELTYDNYIIGGAYQRDFLQFNSGLLLGAEVGLADRVGRYKICCATVAYADSVMHSAELWAGVGFRHEGLNLFDAFRISPGFVFGLSAISNPIGQEGDHQFVHRGSAKLLFYLGFEVAFGLKSLPNTELVYRVHHRSGAYGTLGGLKEGNNANVIGIRQRF